MDSIKEPDVDKHASLEKQIATLKTIKPKDATHETAIANTISNAQALSNAYRDGSYTLSYPEEQNSRFILAMHGGNIVGSLRASQNKNWPELAFINSATSIHPGAATAMNHALIKHHLAPNNLGINSQVYSRENSDDKWGRPQQRTRENAQRYHEELGRRVGWHSYNGLYNYPTSPGNWSMWTPEDIQHINTNVKVDKENVSLI